MISDGEGKRERGRSGRVASFTSRRRLRETGQGAFSPNPGEKRRRKLGRIPSGIYYP